MKPKIFYVINYDWENLGKNSTVLHIWFPFTVIYQKYVKNQCFAGHNVKHNQNLHTQKPNLLRLERMQRYMSCFCLHTVYMHKYVYLAQKPDIYYCICSNRDIHCFMWKSDIFWVSVLHISTHQKYIVIV